MASDITVDKTGSAGVRGTDIYAPRPQENLSDPDDFLAKVEFLPPQYRRVMLGMAQGSIDREIARQLDIVKLDTATRAKEVIKVMELRYVELTVDTTRFGLS